MNKIADLINKGVLNDQEIMALHGHFDADGVWIPVREDEAMITPFIGTQVRETPETIISGRTDGKPGIAPMTVNKKIISYGLSSFGYDVRLGRQFKVFNSVQLGDVPVIDPKNPRPGYFVDFEGDRAIIPPNSFLLGHTIEYFRVPEDVLVLCIGKSTYARCGLVVNVTPLEPEWQGQVTIEISNTTQLPAIVYANEGIAQFLFIRGNRPLTTYSDRNGKYQGQVGVTPART